MNRYTIHIMRNQMKHFGSGQGARTTVARASCPPPNFTTALFHFLPSQHGWPARLQSNLLTNMHRGLRRAFSAVAMAAEIHDAVRQGDAAVVARLLKKTPKLVDPNTNLGTATSLNGMRLLP